MSRYNDLPGDTPVRHVGDCPQCEGVLDSVIRPVPNWGHWLITKCNACEYVRHQRLDGPAVPPEQMRLFEGEA